MKVVAVLAAVNRVVQSVDAQFSEEETEGKDMDSNLATRSVPARTRSTATRRDDTAPHGARTG